LADVTSLIANPRNPNRHPDKQIAMLAKIIRHQGWRAPITVSNRSGFVVTGHGRLEAAKLLQVEKVPVDRQDFATEADEWAHLIADNRIAELAEIDNTELSELLKELDGKIELDLAGFDDVDANNESDSSAHAKDISDQIGEKFEVVIECRDESAQREAFEKFSNEGFKCRLLTF
jgi:ParB-like chromosome segregation protein Spo0J